MEKKSKIVAALLALFLGGLGIYKFYFGQTKQGIIMLSVVILGAICAVVEQEPDKIGSGAYLTGLIAFIDFIKILVNKYTVNKVKIELK